MSNSSKLITLKTNVNGGVISIQKNKIIAVENSPGKQSVLNGALLHIDSIANPIFVRESIESVIKKVWG